MDSGRRGNIRFLYWRSAITNVRAARLHAAKIKGSHRCSNLPGFVNATSGEMPAGITFLVSHRYLQRHQPSLAARSDAILSDQRYSNCAVRQGSRAAACSWRMFLVCGNGELKRRAGIRIASSPQLSAVGFDDRPADRQTHAHAAGLGGEEGGEQPVEVRRVDPGAGVLDRHEHPLRRALRSNLELARCR